MFRLAGQFPNRSQEQVFPLSLVLFSFQESSLQEQLFLSDQMLRAFRGLLRRRLSRKAPEEGLLLPSQCALRLTSRIFLCLL